MPGLTDHFGFTTLGPGEALSADGYKFPRGDRRLLDALLWTLFDHHHTGDPGVDNHPTTGFTLTPAATGGTYEGGLHLVYRYSVVDPNGVETAASPEQAIDLDPVVATPGAPAIDSINTGSGTLLPGNYAYRVTAYKGPNTAETEPSDPVSVNVVSPTSTNAITLLLPTSPTGADGFNIYRRKPGGTSYIYLASVAGGGPYTDDGSDVEDCDRRAPIANTTSTTNQVTVAPTAAIPAGWRWRLYRRIGAGGWNNSFLAEIPSGTTSYVDTGQAVTPGTPLDSTPLVPSPPKVDPSAEIDWSTAEIGGPTDELGFYGAAPIAQPSAYTQTYATADKTLAAYTPDDESVAYTGATDGEAKLADLNALRTAVENLRAFTEDTAAMLNAVVDDLQALGLVG